MTAEAPADQRTSTRKRSSKSLPHVRFTTAAVRKTAMFTIGGTDYLAEVTYTNYGKGVWSWRISRHTTMKTVASGTAIEEDLAVIAVISEAGKLEAAVKASE